MIVGRSDGLSDRAGFPTTLNRLHACCLFRPDQRLPFLSELASADLVAVRRLDLTHDLRRFLRPFAVSTSKDRAACEAAHLVATWLTQLTQSSRRRSTARPHRLHQPEASLCRSRRRSTESRWAGFRKIHRSEPGSPSRRNLRVETIPQTVKYR